MNKEKNWDHVTEADMGRDSLKRSPQKNGDGNKSNETRKGSRTL